MQSTQAVITWTTNKPGTSEVEYGTTSSYGQSSTYGASLVTNHSITLTGLTPGTVYHYRVKSWDASNNHLVSSDFTLTTASAGGDSTAPTASLNPGASIANGASTYTFSVTYSDNTAVKASSIGSNNILVTGPNGFSQVAKFLSASSSTNGSPITATYQITAPNGAWSSAANGQYTISEQANQVTDTSGNPVATGSMGTFTVNLTQRLPGDANGDGVVDFSDLIVLEQTYNSTVKPNTAADFNGDGVVNFADLVILEQVYTG